MEGLLFYMEGDGTFGLVFVMHERKPVSVFGGKKKNRWGQGSRGGVIDGRVGTNEANERLTY